MGRAMDLVVNISKKKKGKERGRKPETTPF